MKIIFIILLCLIPFSGYGRLDEKALKRVLTNEYLTTLCKEHMKFPGEEPSLVFEKIQELFPHSFKNTKIYLIVFRDENKVPDYPEFYPAVYAVDISSGKPISFSDKEAFCNFVNKAYKPIVNLDKAYLYLCLYLKVFQGSFYMPEPRLYLSDVRQNSKFASDTGVNSLQAFFGWSRETWLNCTNLVNPKKTIDSLTLYSKYQRQLCRDYLNSSVNKIAISSSEIKCNPVRQTEFHSQFSFDENNNLISIETETVADTLR